MGVDLDNYPALRLYWRAGFTRLLLVGEDAGGRFVKLLRVETCGCNFEPDRV